MRSLVLTLLLAPSSLGQVQPGDILVTLFGCSGQGRVQHYRGDGTLVSSAGLVLIDPATGQESASFTLDRTASPADVAVFQDGTLAIADAANSEVDLYTPAGQYVESFAAPGLDVFCVDVESADHLWVGHLSPIGAQAVEIRDYTRELSGVPLAPHGMRCPTNPLHPMPP
ncbi:MAG: hypothetical protein GY711_07100 [bacterium]|nr:hypothetical protein [bacterium]